MERGDIVTVQIEDMSSEGQGMGIYINLPLIPPVKKEMGENCAMKKMGARDIRWFVRRPWPHQKVA